MLGRMRTILAILLLATAAPAGAAEPMTPSEFRDYAEGYTLYFERDGEYFGSEHFEEGHRTRWRFRDGTCVDGVWTVHGAQLCFFYGVGTEVLCWRMLREENADNGDIIARLLGDGPDAGMELRIVRRDRKPLLCSAGPGAET